MQYFIEPVVQFMFRIRVAWRCKVMNLMVTSSFSKSSRKDWLP